MSSSSSSCAVVVPVNGDIKNLPTPKHWQRLVLAPRTVNKSKEKKKKKKESGDYDGNGNDCKCSSSKQNVSTICANKRLITCHCHLCPPLFPSPHHVTKCKENIQQFYKKLIIITCPFPPPHGIANEIKQTTSPQIAFHPRCCWSFFLLFHRIEKCNKNKQQVYKKLAIIAWSFFFSSTSFNKTGTNNKSV